MKNNNIMDYEKKYKEALERAKSLIDFCSDAELKTLECVFPELKESEDGRIIKHIISVLEDCWQTCKNIDYDSSRIQEDIAWLEKQEPKQKWVDRACKWIFDNFRISSFDSQKIVTDFTNMYDLRDSFIKATEE